MRSRNRRLGLWHCRVSGGWLLWLSMLSGMWFMHKIYELATIQGTLFNQMFHTQKLNTRSFNQLQL